MSRLVNAFVECSIATTSLIVWQALQLKMIEKCRPDDTTHYFGTVLHRAIGGDNSTAIHLR